MDRGRYIGFLSDFKIINTSFHNPNAPLDQMFSKRDNDFSEEHFYDIVSKVVLSDACHINKQVIFKIIAGYENLLSTKTEGK